MAIGVSASFDAPYTFKLVNPNTPRKNGRNRSADDSEQNGAIDDAVAAVAGAGDESAGAGTLRAGTGAAVALGGPIASACDAIGRRAGAAVATGVAAVAVACANGGVAEWFTLAIAPVGAGVLTTTQHKEHERVCA